MLLPDETYDVRIPCATLATTTTTNLNLRITDCKLLAQTDVATNTDTTLQNAVEHNSSVIGTYPHSKYNHDIIQCKHDDSLSGSEEDVISGNNDNERQPQKQASNFFSNILKTLNDDLPTFDEFLAVAGQSENDAATSDSHNSSASGKGNGRGNGIGCSGGGTNVNNNSSKDMCHLLEDANTAQVLRVVCEDFLRRHRMRPDFFCQYHKAISAVRPKTTKTQSPRPTQTKQPNTPKNLQQPSPTALITRALQESGAETPSANISGTTPVVDTATAVTTESSESSKVLGISSRDVLHQATAIIYTLPLNKRKKVCNNVTFEKAAVTDASSSNEAVHLQQRLKSLSTELVTLRNRLHVGQTHSTNAGGNVTLPPTGQQQQQQQQQPSPAGHNLNASTPNLHSNVHHNGNNSNNNNNNNNNSNINNALQQQQQQQHQLSSSHSTIIPTIGHSNSKSSNNTNNNHIANAPLTQCNNNSHTNNNINTKLHSFNHTLPHSASANASTTAVTAAALSGSVSGIISTRNTSIPHPLPISIQQAPPTQQQQLQHQHQHSAHTLPMRSATAGAYTHHNHNHSHHNHNNNHNHNHNHSHSHNNQPFSQIPTQKQHGSCNSSAFSNTVAPFGLTNANSAQRSVSQLQLGGAQPHNNNSFGGGNASKQPTEIEDLIHLPGPLTEDAVMRTLQARFTDNCYFTNVGPILLSINPYRDVGNPLTLSSTRSLPLAPQLHKIVQEAVRQQTETGYPQAIILSGTSGAGKTHCSMLLLRQLFAIAGGGPETDAFKHLAAAFTVLRSLGSAKTTTNSESSRIGQFIEVQVTDGALYRTKIHCYFLDQTRVIRPLPKEKNYHIFYQMLAGLSREERVKLNLEGYSPANLRYLQSGDVMQNEQEDSTRFQAWKACLGILGIPFLDVVRVLAAVLLLGNVQFIDGQGLEVDVKGEAELNSVASLLGVPPAALFRGLTTRTHNARGQLVKSVCDANMSNMTRDCLAKALYCRTVATIVRRANSLKRLGSTLGTLSSDSNESVHNQADVASQHASTIGGNSGSKSMAALNNAVRHATDGFIGILDMFGFEEPSHAQLEHLCINLCAETMQHFYNTHIFKSSVESCRDEGIVCDTEVDYVDNVPCIDLISSLRTGLLSMLDAECSIRGTAESYVAKIKVQHRNSTRLETKHTSEPHDPRMFMIRHFAGRVEYDTTDFLDTNRDVVRDDLVAVFYKHTCNFGFATHLFGSELKALYALQNVPRGLSFRISPTSHTDLLNGDEPVSTLTQDFHTRLDNLLRTLVHARPHFVRCIRSNSSESSGCFERSTVVRQIRSLQVLETVNLMASGFPHRMRFKQFNARYVAMLAPYRLHRRNEEKAMEDCNLILQYAMENPPILDGSVTLAWAPGKRHVFLSEGMRQHLEHLRAEIRAKSATLVQATWRGWHWRKKMGNIKRPRNIGGGGSIAMLSMPPSANTSTAKMTKLLSNGGASSLPRLSAKTTNLIGTVTRPRPQPIAGTPPPDPNEKCDTKIIQQTCSLFGLDLERPPPVPPSRAYTIAGNSKLGYPQSRVMKMNFPDDASIANPSNNGIAAADAQQLKKGDTVSVVGASTCRGHLIVEHKSQSYHVPFQYMELLRPCGAAAMAGGGSNNGATNNPNTTNNANNNNSNANNSNSHCNNKNNNNSNSNNGSGNGNGNLATANINVANNNNNNNGAAVAATVNI